jgi:hypothetical protein
MTQANCVHSTPLTNASAIKNDLLSAVEAFSPAIRLRHQIIAAKTASPPSPLFPPPIDDRANEDPFWAQMDYADRAAAEGHPLADLIRLRQEAADAIQRLLAFLDASEGIIGEDVFDGDEDAAVDDAGCDEDFDAEPSLGSANPHEVSVWVDQALWALGSADDREQDAAESGIADLDGLLEQVGSQDWTHTVMG